MKPLAPTVFLLVSATNALCHAAAPASALPELPTVTIQNVTPYGGSQSVDDLTTSSQHADAPQLEDSHALDVSQYLNRRVGSVYVNDIQGNALQPDVNYRGYTASPLLGTPQGLSVYVDGVRLNQPFGDVVSWDLIPRAAIETIDLIGGGNPLYGFNSLGGALSLRTRDGYSAPGTTVHLNSGSHVRRQAEITSGGHASNGFYWFGTANRLKDGGWRMESPTDASQAFARIGYRTDRTDIALSGSYVDSDLTGNGLQEIQLLRQDYRSVYTKPDVTRNRAALYNLQVRHAAADGVTLAGNAWYRNIRTRTFNGDINEASLGESLYQPAAAERTALAQAGYSGFPTSGESQANTPFPSWRCIANALLNDEPNEKCNGLINRTETDQSVSGLAAQVQMDRPVGGYGNRFIAGFTFERSHADFTQSSQFGYLTPDRGVIAVTGPGAFADGTQNSENAFDARVDLHGRTTNQGFFFADTMTLSNQWAASVSARYDRSHTTTRDALTPGGGAGSLDGDNVFARLNPALGLVYRPTARLALTASYSEASRAPSAIELGCADPANPCRMPNAMAGDPPLRQVVTQTVELGVRGNVSAALAWSAAVFRGDSRDDLLFVADNQAGFGYFRNFGKTRRQGIELGSEAAVGHWQIGAHYTWLDATFQSPETVNGSGNSSNDGPALGFEGNIRIAPGNRLPLVPQQMLKANVAWSPIPALTFQADMLYTGNSYARGNENGSHKPDGLYYLGPGRIGGYAVLNLGVEWRAKSHLSLYAQVDNALDRRYSSAAQLAATPFNAQGAFAARPFAAPVIGGERPLWQSTLVAPGAPRAFLVGFRFHVGS